VHIHILDIFDCAILFANRIIIAVNTDRPELLLINLSPDGFYSFTKTVCEIITPQPFYGPSSGTTRVSQCQKRPSGLYGTRGD